MCNDTTPAGNGITSAEQILGPRDREAERVKRERVRQATRKMGHGVDKRMAEYREQSRQIKLGEKS